MEKEIAPLDLAAVLVKLQETHKALRNKSIMGRENLRALIAMIEPHVVPAMQSDPTVPRGELWFVQDSKVVGKIVGIAP